MKAPRLGITSGFIEVEATCQTTAHKSVYALGIGMAANVPSQQVYQAPLPLLVFLALVFFQGDRVPLFRDLERRLDLSLREALTSRASLSWGSSMDITAQRVWMAAWILPGSPWLSPPRDSLSS